MDLHVRDGLIEDYEELIDGIKLPDPNDRHVLAAAIKANAQTIVTYNLSDFPSSALSKYEIDAQHPDEFLRHLLDMRLNLLFLGDDHLWPLRLPCFS